MATGDIEHPSRWINIVQIHGGRVAFCRLCGKSTKRSFMANVTNYAEALKAAHEYADEHLASPTHRAALDVFFAEDAPPASAEQEMLVRLFGGSVPDERQRRRTAARRAAETAQREQKLARERAVSAAALDKQQATA